MINKIFRIIVICFFIGFSILLGTKLLGGGQQEKGVIENNIANGGKIVFKEQRRGYEIEIRNQNGSSNDSQFRILSGVPVEEKVEVLLIDGEVVPYIKTKDGYSIYYEPISSDLSSAAKNYVDTQPQKTND